MLYLKVTTEYPHMTKEKTYYTVMFIDFVGSTKLYELMGDQQANQIISNVIGIMSNIIHAHNGQVIKTIGDELMCCFNETDNAMAAACKIQSTIDDLPEKNGFSIAVRIGMHFGTALRMDDGDLFGDAVNVAGRVVGMARAGQIITTEKTFKKLDEINQLQCRKIDTVSVKGKKDKINIYQAVWEPHEATMLSPSFEEAVDTSSDSTFKLKYQHKEHTISRQTPCLMFGRSKQCDLIVDTDHASRRHARIEYRRGKFVLIDQSTNGTFVTLANGKQIYLKREEMALWGDGIISIGSSQDLEHRAQLFFFS